MKIIGLDPSEHNTGCILCSYANNEISLLACGVLKNYKEVFEMLKIAKDIVVMEDYRSKITTKDQLKAAKMCGFIAGICYCYGYKLYPQMPAVRKGYISLAKKMLSSSTKEEINKYKAIQHVIDALSHVLRYIVKEVK